jgi:VanZ family protein
MSRRPSRDRLLLALTVAVQLVVLYAPRAPSAGSVPGLDKVVHAAVFGAVAWAALRCGFARSPVAVVLVAHAVLSEVLQAGLLPARSGDPLDVVADLAGVVLALVLGRSALHGGDTGRTGGQGASADAAQGAASEATRRA